MGPMFSTPDGYQSQSGQEKRFKDTMKTNINVNIWEIQAPNHPQWHYGGRQMRKTKEMNCDLTSSGSTPSCN